MCLVAALIVATCTFIFFATLEIQVLSISPDGTVQGSRLHGVEQDTLVIYIYSSTDPEYLHNLEFFVKEAVDRADRCQYIFVVQDDSGVLPVDLPRLPKNARYVVHRNECYDWGTFGWVLKSGVVDVTSFKYFIFMNSSVRGPFLPVYLRRTMHWTEPLISGITEDIKLVGPTISCEGSPRDGDRNGLWRRNPHVQSYLVATDHTGLNLMMKTGRVFACHKNRWDAIFYSELGSSWAILQGGYNLGSLMIRYQGVDWRNKRNWGCNGQMNPDARGANDGMDLDPTEVLFVKMKAHKLDHRDPAAVKAHKYSAWMTAHRHRNDSGVYDNELTHPRQAALQHVPQVFLQLARGVECFDVDYYLHENADVAEELAKDQDVEADTQDVDALHSLAQAAWEHFVYKGQFEERPFRWLCEADLTLYLEPTSEQVCLS